MADSGGVTLEVGGREIILTHPDKVVFPAAGGHPAITKLDLVAAGADIPAAMRLDGLVAQISRSRTVAAAPEAVWTVLADFGAISSWAGNVDHSCLLEHGPDGPAIGTSRRVQVGRDALVERITDFVPPAVLAYDIEGLPRQLRRVANRWTLIPATGGGTDITLTSTVEIGANPVAELAERAMCRFMSKQSDAMLAGLAEQLEGSL